MSELDLFVDVTNAIESGKLDTRLNQVYAILQRRINSLGVVSKVADFSIGDSVMFNDRCAKADMRGLMATVTGLEDDKVLVQLVEAKEGFSKELSDGSIIMKGIRVEPDLLTKMQ